MRCYNCGKELTEESLICDECGSVNNATEEVPEVTSESNDDQIIYSLDVTNENGEEPSIQDIVADEAADKAVSKKITKIYIKKKILENKTILIAWSLFIMVPLIAIVLLVYCIIPYACYKDAMKLYKAQNYEDAVKAFSDLGGYKNSEEMILNINYDEAMELYKEQDYENAIIVFSDLGGYKNSKEMILTIKQEMYNNFIELVKSDALNRKWESVNNMIENKDEMIPDSEFLDGIKSCILEIQNNEKALNESNNQVIAKRDELGKLQNAFADIESQLAELGKEQEFYHVAYAAKKTDYEIIVNSAFNIDIYIIGLIGSQDGFQEYEVCPARYYYGNKILSEDRALLYTGYTKYTSKGWANLEVVSLSNTDVQVKEDFGGFVQQWPNYLEKSYFDDTIGKVVLADIQEAKEKYDEICLSYDNLKMQKENEGKKVEEWTKSLGDLQAEYSLEAQNTESRKIELENEIYSLLDLETTNEEHSN